jgi:hypothetical protein
MEQPTLIFKPVDIDPSDIYASDTHDDQDDNLMRHKFVLTTPSIEYIITQFLADKYYKLDINNETILSTCTATFKDKILNDMTQSHFTNKISEILDNIKNINGEVTLYKTKNTKIEITYNQDDSTFNVKKYELSPL